MVPATVNGYRKLFNRHVAASQIRDIRLRDFTPGRGRRFLEEIEASNPTLTHTTLKHIRSFLAAVFTFAVSEDLMTGNPIRELRAQDLGGARSKDTYAYSLDEILAMLEVLPEPAKTVVATAAFTGLRLAELRGLKWEDLNGKELRVVRTVWGIHVGDTKTPASRASVPVIPLLQERLEAHRNDFPSDGYIFSSAKTGASLNLVNLANRDIVPALNKTGLEWHGWHAFRRGLATNLHVLGVDGKDIQTILRHSHIATTLNIYTKPDLAKAQAAMAKLSRAWKKKSHNVDKSVDSRELKSA